MTATTDTRTAARVWDPARYTTDGLLLCGLLLAALLLRIALSPGLSGSDDTAYAMRGIEALRGEFLPSPYVGDLRYGVNLPIALFVALLGPSEFSVRMWSLVCSLGEVALIYGLARTLWDRRAALLAGVVAALSPLHVLMGGMALADAPLAFFITLTFVSFFFAERNRSLLLYVVTGAALGFTWWIKPPGILIAGVLLVYAFIVRRWRREWLVVAGVAVAMILAEWAFFWVTFGDPFYALKAVNTTLEREFVHQNAPWGSYVPFYYFRQMFVDGRDMSIAPWLAVAGIAYLVRRGADWKRPLGSGYVLIWGIALILILSFTPSSLSPFKLLPRQDNYALMFLAPVLLLAGYGLSRLPRLVMWPALALYAASAFVLTAVQQYSVQTKADSLRLVVQYAEDHPDEQLYGSIQFRQVLRLRNLITGLPQPEILPLRNLDASYAPALPSGGKRPVAVISQSAEVAKDNSWRTLDQRNPCWRLRTQMIPHGGGPGDRIVEDVTELRPQLPDLLNRHLSFVYRLAEPEHVRIFDWDAVCAGARAGKGATR